jgi:hypothetical protein
MLCQIKSCFTTGPKKQAVDLDLVIERDCSYDLTYSVSRP